MNPKMTVADAAKFLNMSTRQLNKFLRDSDLPFSKTGSSIYFGFEAAQQVFNISIEPTAMAFQIVKGGTGKTSLAQAFAIRASLYGLAVLCIDLDQQGNLTQTFGVNADNLPIMVDILAEGYTFEDSIVEVYPGLDLLASRIENAALDDVIRLKRCSLEKVYRKPIKNLKKEYDLIVVDCPPNLGQSVVAMTLAVDKVVAPVIPEHFALAGLRATSNAIHELEKNFKCDVALNIVLNRFEAKNKLTKDALNLFLQHPTYKNQFLEQTVRLSPEFPNSVARGQSIFDTVRSNSAKQDIDNLTKEILCIGAPPAKSTKRKSTKKKAPKLNVFDEFIS